MKLTKFFNILLLSVFAGALFAGCRSDEDTLWRQKDAGRDQFLLAFSTSDFTRTDVKTRAVAASRMQPDKMNLLLFAKTADASGQLLKNIELSAGDFTAVTTEAGQPALYRKTIGKGEFPSGELTAYLVANSRTMLGTLPSNPTERNFKQLKFSISELGNDQTTLLPLVSQPVAINETVLTAGERGNADVFSLKRPFTRIGVSFNSADRNFLLTGIALYQQPEQADLISAGETNLTLTCQKEYQFIEGPLNGSWTDGHETIECVKEGEWLQGDYLPVAMQETSLDGTTLKQPLLIIRGHFETEKATEGGDAAAVSDDDDEHNFAGTADTYYAVEMNRDLLPNHYYNVQIMGVKAEGRATVAEAVKHPALMAVLITEETPDIHSIISDGQNVLAVQDDVTLDYTGSAKNLTVLMRAAEEITKANLAFHLELSTTESWLTGITDGSATGWSTAATVENLSPTDAESQQGLLTTKVTIPLTAKTNKGGDRSAIVTVKMKHADLERTVTVNQTQEPGKSLSDVFDIKLSITGPSGETLTDQDYFAFLNGDCKGLWIANNGNRSRNTGLHMPMPYGDTQATYTYTVTLRETGKTATLKATSGCGISSDASPKSSWTFSFRSKAGTSLADTDFANRSFTQALTFTLDGSEYSFDLYHTGLFHKDSGKGWLYYEVIGVNGQYWLDRNIGATSAGMSEEGSQLGDEWPAATGSAGGYYNISSSKPSLPPGWAVPSISDLMTLTSGSSFQAMQETANGLQYFAPSVVYSYTVNGTENRAAAYFPQMRRVQGNMIMGQPKTGYYLSSTGSGAGGWYQVAAISGMSVGVENIGLEDGSDASKYGRVSVRAIAERSSGEAKTYTYSVAEKGYTHVFVYRQNSDGSRTVITPWPGEQVAMTINAEKRFHNYVLESYVDYGSRLRVIFNRVDTDNHILASSAVKEGAVASLDLLNASTPGMKFPVSGDTNYGKGYCWCNTGGWVESNHVCGSTPEPPTPPTPEIPEIAIRWKTSVANANNIHLYYGTKVYIAWDTGAGTVSGDYRYFKFKPESSDIANNIVALKGGEYKYILHTGSNENAPKEWNPTNVTAKAKTDFPAAFQADYCFELKEEFVSNKDYYYAISGKLTTDTWDDYKMKETAAGIWTLTIANIHNSTGNTILEGEKCQFGIKKKRNSDNGQTDWLAALNSEILKITSTGTYQATNGSPRNNWFWNMAGGTYTFTYDENTKKLTISK